MHHFIIICEFKLKLQSGSGEVALWPLWPWPLTSDLDLLHGPYPGHWLVITPENFMMIRWWEHSQEGVTDRQTERQTNLTIHRAAWSQLKQGKSEGFESCDRFIVRKRPIWVKIGDVLYRVTLKFDRWPWKTIGHLSFAVSSFVQHFVAIGDFKLELQSGNTQFRSNSTIF